jgi:hypothetical protein
VNLKATVLAPKIGARERTVIKHPWASLALFAMSLSLLGCPGDTGGDDSESSSSEASTGSLSARDVAQRYVRVLRRCVEERHRKEVLLAEFEDEFMSSADRAVVEDLRKARLMQDRLMEGWLGPDSFDPSEASVEIKLSSVDEEGDTATATIETSVSLGGQETFSRTVELVRESGEWRIDFGFEDEVQEWRAAVATCAQLALAGAEVSDRALLSCEVRNGGERPIDGVLIAVAFLDAAGETVYECDGYLDFFGQPLQPGHTQACTTTLTLAEGRIPTSVWSGEVSVVPVHVQFPYEE